MPFRKNVINWAQQRLKTPQSNETTPDPSASGPSSSNDTTVENAQRGHNSASTTLGPEHVCFEASPVHQHHKRGQLPLSVSTVKELGDVHSETTYVKRDLGFPGQIGDKVFLSYGDTMYSDKNYSDEFRGMTSDSVALATHDPLKVVDICLNDQGYPDQFCPIMDEYDEDASTCALGITNVVETFPGQGILYFLLNHRPNGVNKLVGAGVATVNVSNTYPPSISAQRTSQYWWDGATEPWFGDVGAVRSGDHIYVYGHANDSPHVYLARVSWQSATDLSCYEYWNGDCWQTDRLVNPGEKEGVFWQVNQGQVVYSNYYDCFLFIYCSNWADNKVLAQTAPAPEGPWSDPITVHQATPITNGSFIYAATPHTYFDTTGQTLVVTFTNHPNTIQAIHVTFT